MTKQIASGIGSDVFRAKQEEEGEKKRTQRKKFKEINQKRQSFIIFLFI